MELRAGGGSDLSPPFAFCPVTAKLARRRLKRSASAFVVSVAVAAGLCGCGTSGTPLHEVNTAVRRTLAVTWLRYELSLERPSLFKAPLSVQGGRAAYDVRTGLAYAFLQLRLRSGGYQLLFCDLEPSTFLLGPSPAPAGVLPPGKSWISAPLSTPSADHTLAAQAEGLAPALLLHEVEWGARSATSLGTRVVEAVPMAEYRVSVDLAPALAAATRARQRGIAAAIEEELHASRSKRLEVAVWVNGPGYVGKIAADVPGSRLGTTSLLFSSFTRPYTGTVPPASQVVPLASLVRGSESVWAIATGS
jgi:hypothetical protein